MPMTAAPSPPAVRSTAGNSHRSRRPAPQTSIARLAPHGAPSMMASGAACRPLPASRYGFLAPFGGRGKSGIGRELGMHALELYTEVKNVFVSLED